MDQWYVQLNETDIAGPFILKQLHRALDRNEIPRNALVCRKGTKEWVHWSTIAELVDDKTSVGAAPSELRYERKAETPPVVASAPKLPEPVPETPPRLPPRKTRLRTAVVASGAVVLLMLTMLIVGGLTVLSRLSRTEQALSSAQARIDTQASRLDAADQSASALGQQLEGVRASASALAHRIDLIGEHTVGVGYREIPWRFKSVAGASSMAAWGRPKKDDPGSCSVAGGFEFSSGLPERVQARVRACA